MKDREGAFFAGLSLSLKLPGTHSPFQWCRQRLSRKGLHTNAMYSVTLQTEGLKSLRGIENDLIKVAEQQCPC